MTKRKCTNCKYCVEEDYGYSNWTVEGTTIDCLLNLNPGLPKDRWYGHEPNLLFGETCPKFTEGEPVCLDVECTYKDPDEYASDLEIKELLLKQYQWAINK